VRCKAPTRACSLPPAPSYFPAGPTPTVVWKPGPIPVHCLLVSELRRPRYVCFVQLSSCLIFPSRLGMTARFGMGFPMVIKRQTFESRGELICTIRFRCGIRLVVVEWLPPFGLRLTMVTSWVSIYYVCRLSCRSSVVLGMREFIHGHRIPESSPSSQLQPPPACPHHGFHRQVSHYFF